MPALPETDSPLVQSMADQHADFLGAYNVCLEYEKEVATDADKLRYVRILGFLLLHAPSYAVRTEVTRYIHSRGDDNVLAELGAFFERNVIVPREFLRLPLAFPTCQSIFRLIQSRSTEVEHQNPVTTHQGLPLRS